MTLLVLPSSSPGTHRKTIGARGSSVRRATLVHLEVIPDLLPRVDLKLRRNRESSRSMAGPRTQHRPRRGTWSRERKIENFGGSGGSASSFGDSSVSIADTDVHRMQSSKFRQQLQWHTRVNTHCQWRSCFFNRAPSRAMPRALRRGGGNLDPDRCDNKLTCFTQSRTQARTRGEASRSKEHHMLTSSEAAHKSLHELAGALLDKGFELGR